jgi:hypothetical protein
MLAIQLGGDTRGTSVRRRGAGTGGEGRRPRVTPRSHQRRNVDGDMIRAGVVPIATAPFSEDRGLGRAILRGLERCIVRPYQDRAGATRHSDRDHRSHDGNLAMNQCSRDEPLRVEPIPHFTDRRVHEPARLTHPNHGRREQMPGRDTRAPTVRTRDLRLAAGTPAARSPCYDASS